MFFISIFALIYLKVLAQIASLFPVNTFAAESNHRKHFGDFQNGHKNSQNNTNQVSHLIMSLHCRHQEIFSQKYWPFEIADRYDPRVIHMLHALVQWHSPRENQILQLGLGGGVVLPYESPMGMCRWMGSHFHDWIDYNGVAFSIELLEWGRTFSDFWGQKVLLNYGQQTYHQCLH